MSTDESKDGEASPQASGETTTESAEADARPSDATETARPKRMKKKKAAPSEPTAAPAPVDDSPEGKKLREAEVAFEVGDYAVCRKLATELARSDRPAIADGARDLLRRTNVDPAQMVFLAACACALFAVAFYYLR